MKNNNQKPRRYQNQKAPKESPRSQEQKSEDRRNPQKDSRSSKYPKASRFSKDSRSFKDSRFSIDDKDSRSSRFSRDDKDSRSSRFSRDDKDSKKERSSRYSKEARDFKSSRFSKNPRDTKKLFVKKDFTPRDSQSSNPPENKVFGKNAVIECLNSDISVNKIWLLNVHNPKLKEIETLARNKKIPVIRSPRQELERLAQGEDHRSVVAEICPVKIYDEDFLYQKNNQEKFKKIIIAVNIEDPHNLGAILRSAMAFGVDALIFTARKSTQITSTVISSSAGAALKIPLVRIGNTTDSVLRLKEHGYWIYGTCVDQDKTTSLNKISFHDRSVVLVGNEGKGLSDKVLKHCDYSVYIPVEFNSLNVSVATGIVLYQMSISKP
jgi:23S rRNA (guanosine2251-2'-O)-methyltransferase